MDIVVIAQLHRVVEVDPTYHFAWNDLGVIYSEIMQQNRQAIAQYELALSNDSTYAEAWYNGGVSWLRESDTRMAQLCFEKALQYDPDLIIDIVDLADAYFNEGRYMEPFVLYPFILYQDSTLASPTKNLGLCYLVNNDTITAVFTLKNPSN